MQKRRIEKPKVCDATCKERIKKIKDENKVKKIELMTSWKTQFRPKGVVPKDPKLGGGDKALKSFLFLSSMYVGLGGQLLMIDFAGWVGHYSN
ncbi:hypothetical protein NC653_036366 [Populus alba x Populus x berolinensis]|uniref:Transmembrane protein n=1 Tax=Populus alba x Populus x berolinensis TaxID=444605 RepID=A0AAD6LJX8_9ROSI|nr:hypothetical protein NC653_036366 [Populus alba x Populus x berolinensis]